MIPEANSSRFSFFSNMFLVQTTERYIGSRQAFEGSVNDKLESNRGESATQHLNVEAAIQPLATSR